MKYSRALIIVVIVGLLGALAWFVQPKATRPNEQTPESNVTGVACTKEYAPVCGVDGVTYSNPCVATEQHDVAIATQGECPPQSGLADHERSNLFWLLHERELQKLQGVSIKHLKTVAESCSGCYDIYYTWGEPPVIARLQVRNGKVENGVDTTGYDYIAKQQGSPISFSEL